MVKKPLKHTRSYLRIGAKGYGYASRICTDQCYSLPRNRATKSKASEIHVYFMVRSQNSREKHEQVTVAAQCNAERTTLLLLASHYNSDFCPSQRYVEDYRGPTEKFSHRQLFSALFIINIPHQSHYPPYI
jgi:hypothetical protein